MEENNNESGNAVGIQNKSHQPDQLEDGWKIKSLSYQVINVEPKKLHSQHEDRNGKGRDEGSDKGLDDDNINFFYHFVNNNRLLMENSKLTL